MRVSYGPPGQKGVTTLMAVGAADFDETNADRAVTRGLQIAAAAFVGGLVFHSKTTRNASLGAAIALLGVRWASRLGKVAVTTPAP